MNMKTILVLIFCTSFSINAFAESRCSVEQESWFKAGKISCSYQSLTIASSNITSREVKFQLPLGAAPTGGWPVVI